MLKFTRYSNVMIKHVVPLSTIYTPMKVTRKGVNILVYIVPIKLAIKSLHSYLLCRAIAVDYEIFLSPRRVQHFSCGVIFTRARVSLALLSPRKNGITRSLRLLQHKNEIISFANKTTRSERQVGARSNLAIFNCKAKFIILSTRFVF